MEIIPNPGLSSINVLCCRKKKRSPSQATEAGASLAASSQRQRSVRRGKSVRQVLPKNHTSQQRSTEACKQSLQRPNSKGFTFSLLQVKRASEEARGTARGLAVRSDSVRSKGSITSSKVRRAGSMKRGSVRKTGSIRKRRTVTGDPKGKDKGKGDIYTKVAIPRSKSFMNVSGQYNLQELFKELREKEGIESVDDILREVISSGGMSFNKIKPVYKEMLMKLVMTMSKDEIFIRSQNIMNEQKKKGTKTKNWPNFGSKAAKEGRFLQNPPKQIKGLQQGKRKINKADIGNPVPISIPKKFAVRVEDLLEGLEQPKKDECGHTTEGHTTEDPYTSCSECGYQSLCGSVCSCSLAGTLRRKGGEKSGDSSGCSSCECSECREAGDVCYSCSLYNESQGTVRSRIFPATSSPVPAPDTPLTAWRKAMLASQVNDERLEAMAGMSSSAVPRPRTSSSSMLPLPRPSPIPMSAPPKQSASSSQPKSPTTSKTTPNSGQSKSSTQLKPSSSSVQLRPSSSSASAQQKTPRSTNKSARRQFRAVQRVQETSEGLSSSSESPHPRPRPPRSLSSSHASTPRPPPSVRPAASTHSSVSRPPPISRPTTSASSRPRPPSSTAREANSPGAVHVNGFFKNLDTSPSTSLVKPEAAPPSGPPSLPPKSGTLRSEGSVSIDSLSGSSGYSQKIAFSETNMQSSLGYLP